MSIEILAFQIDSQQYAVALANVIEVLRAAAISRLPAGPRVIEGVIDVRGRIVPVLDLRARFRHPARALDPSEHFILVHASTRVVAMRVDQALDILDIEPSDVEALDAAVPRARYVAGVAKTAGGIVLIHDPAAFLSESESESLDRALDEVQSAPG